VDTTGLNEKRWARLQTIAGTYAGQPRERLECTDVVVRTDDFVALVTAARQARRLRAVLKQIQQWDCLNPPNPELCADHAWLKQLVDAALENRDA
jgi:hypothetical protein